MAATDDAGLFLGRASERETQQGLALAVSRLCAEPRVSLAARLENQRQQADDNEQTDEKDNADRSADKFQHDCLLFARCAP
jgi:hypothetical protein